MSNFSVETGRGKDDSISLRAVPVVYGDPTRQVANIIRNNSENALNYAPKIACYVRELNYDRERMQNPYHIEKQHLRERGIDADGNYTNEMGAGYTVEKVMPSPFRLEVTADIFSSNTDQKLQIMEQILYLFNPDFEIEGLDLIRVIKLNCIDAITGSTLNINGLDSTQFSWNVPVGTQNGARFRIGQQGLWSIDHPVRGSLILHIDLVVPSNLTAEQLITLEKISQELKDNTGTL